MPLQNYTIIAEPRYAEEAIASEANDTYSRDNITVAAGQNLGACVVLGVITDVGATKGQYKAVNPAATDGTQTAVAMLTSAVNATAAAAPGVAIKRQAELRASDLDFGTLNTGQIATAKAQLVAAGLIIREGV